MSNRTRVARWAPALMLVCFLSHRSEGDLPITEVNSAVFPHGFASDVVTEIVPGDGTYAYVANNESTSGKKIYILRYPETHPTQAEVIAKLDDGAPESIRKRGNYLFVGGSSSHVWDVSDRRNPLKIAVIPSYLTSTAGTPVPGQCDPGNLAYGGLSNKSLELMILARGEFLVVPYQKKSRFFVEGCSPTPRVRLYDIGKSKLDALRRQALDRQELLRQDSDQLQIPIPPVPQLPVAGEVLIPELDQYLAGIGYRTVLVADGKYHTAIYINEAQATDPGGEMFVLNASIAGQLSLVQKFGTKFSMPSIAMRSNAMYLANSQGFAMFDVTNVFYPQPTGQYVSGFADVKSFQRLALRGTVLLAGAALPADGNTLRGAIEVVSVASPLSPRRLGASATVPGDFRGLSYPGGRTLYVADNLIGAWAVDLGTTFPGLEALDVRFADHVDTAGEGHDTWRDGQWLYEMSHTGGLYVWRMTRGADGRETGALQPRHLHTYINGHKHLLRIGAYLYCFQYDGPTAVWHIGGEHAGNPEPVSGDFGNQLYKIMSLHYDAGAKRIYAAGLSRGTSKSDPPKSVFYIVDVSQPEAPRLVGEPVVVQYRDAAGGYRNLGGYPYDLVVKRVAGRSFAFYTYRSTNGSGVAQRVTIEITDELLPFVQLTPISDREVGPMVAGEGGAVYLRNYSVCPNRPTHLCGGVLTYQIDSAGLLVAGAQIYDQLTPEGGQAWNNLYADPYSFASYRIERFGRYLYTSRYKYGAAVVYDVLDPTAPKYMDHAQVLQATAGNWAYQVRVQNGVAYHPILGGYAMSRVPWDDRCNLAGACAPTH